MRVFSVVNEPVGGSFALSLPFLLSLWSRGVGWGGEGGVDIELQAWS